MNGRFQTVLGVSLALASVACAADTCTKDSAGVGQAVGANRSASTPAVAPAANGSRDPHIPFEKYVLPNGLEVILHADHATPVVAVYLSYHVGSKEDPPGRTGLAHLFEHLMFQGSKHHNRDYITSLERVGGSVNATTTFDRTDYYETVPANYLALALWLESDRMGWLLAALGQTRLVNQREVVKNEQRLSYHSRPYAWREEVLPAAFYPPDHPYSWYVLGLTADLDATTLDDAADFFRRYYHPGNATLCVAGDFDAAEAKRLVVEYFGPIPGGPRVERPRPRPAVWDAAKRLRMVDRAKYSQITIHWETVPLLAPDGPALDILARILGGDGQTSRLHRGLVRGRQVAQQAGAWQDGRQLAGMINVFARPCDGCPLAEVEAALWDEIRRLRSTPPAAAEVAQAINQWEMAVVWDLARDGVLQRADRLQHYNYYTGDPGYLATDLKRHRAVDPAAVHRAAKQYLGDSCLVLEMVPGTEPAVVPDPRKAAVTARENLAAQRSRQIPVTMSEPPEDPSRQSLPGPGRVSAFQFPPIRRARLSNGMNVLVAENHQLPIVSLDVWFPAGAVCDPAEKLGLAYLMSQLWDKGTERRSAERLADELAQFGVKLSVDHDRETTTVGCYCLSRHFGPVVEILGDVLKSPAFPQAEFERERKIALSRLERFYDYAHLMGHRALDVLLYGEDHPYGRLSDGSPASLRSFTRDDVETFYHRWIRPEQAAAIVVGDVTLPEAVAELEKSVGTWKRPGRVAGITIPDPPARKPTGIVLLDRPGATQSLILVGLVGAERNSLDFYALELMNTVLAGPFSSRLNMNLREAKGLTYGMSAEFRWCVRKPGPYVASTFVDTPATARAIAEIVREYEGLAGPRPASPQELEFARSNIARRYPSNFETAAGVARQIRTLVQFGLPDDEFNRYLRRLQAVTAADVAGVARKYLDVAHLAVVVVGDRAKIEGDLRTLPIARDLQTMQLDDQLRLVPAAVPATHPLTGH